VLTALLSIPSYRESRANRLCGEAGRNPGGPVRGSRTSLRRRQHRVALEAANTSAAAARRSAHQSRIGYDRARNQPATVGRRSERAEEHAARRTTRESQLDSSRGGCDWAWVAFRTCRFLAITVAVHQERTAKKFW
ncbi:unnamed protein product, partial [Acanthoscelides obtectus]